MLWLALHLPWLPLEALPDDGFTHPARCVVEQRLVLVATKAARAAGVEPGMSAATAATLAPQVQQLARDARREADFVRLLALALARYTPQIVLQADGVLLEVAASLRLFGGLRQLVRQVEATLRDCAAHARLAIAPTAAAAALLARVPSGTPGRFEPSGTPGRSGRAAASGRPGPAGVSGRPGPADVSGRPGRALRLPRTKRLLDALPLPAVLAALREPPRLAELLQAIGCRNVGEVRALPRAGLHKRGGGELLLALDRACGDAPDPQDWFVAPERFALSIELMHRADDAARLVFAAGRLVQALAGWLSRQWLAASRLRLCLRQERGRRTPPGDEPPLAGRRLPRDAAGLRPVQADAGRARTSASPEDSRMPREPTRHAGRVVVRLGAAGLSPLGGQLPDEALLIELGAPSRDPAQIVTLLRERLQRHQLAAPVYAIELRLDEAVSSAGREGHLLPDPGQQAEEFQRLIDRLVSRLGTDRVHRLALGNDHRPERASVAVPASSAHPAPAITPPAQPRPVWLLPEPLRLPERGGQPLHGSPLTLLSHAERIEAGWFDGELVCRDYHVAEGDDHRLRWIFRARCGAGGELAWYLHGLFA